MSMQTTDPTRVPTHLRVPSTTFCTYQISFQVDAVGLHPEWRRGGNSATLILGEAAHPPIAFSAGLLGGIQLSQHNVGETTAFRRRWMEG